MRPEIPFMVCLCLASAAEAAEPHVLPVPSVTIYPGEIVTADLLKSRAFRASYARRIKAFVKPERVIGKQAKRTLLRGKPIPLNGLREPYLVRKGQPVRVIFEASGLAIEMPAIALQSGASGESLQARNPETGKIILGQVTAAGDLKVISR